MRSTEKILAHIASIRTGYTFRAKIEGDLLGEITVLQPKDIININKNSITDAVKVKRSEINSLDNHLLKKGDILIANKGLRFSIFLYTGMPDNCIASSSFFVIETDQRQIFPEYLSWYLDQEPSKNYLLSKVAGSIIPSINKSAIQQLPIRIPPLKTQQYIIEILKLSSEELLKLEQLRKKKSEFYNSHIWEKIIQDTDH